MVTPAAQNSRSSAAQRRLAGRRLASGLAASTSLVLLVLVGVAPGWRALPFLTVDTDRVIPLVTLSLVVTVLVGALQAVADAQWLRAAGGFVASTVAVMMLSRLWDVFPFAFDDPAVDWAAITRGAIGLCVAGCVLSMIVQTVVLVRIVVADGAEGRYAGSRS